MIDEKLLSEIQDWIALDPDQKSIDLVNNWLKSNNEAELKKSFNGFLEFGTAGLRGPVRPGPSGMNRAVVGRTAAGIAAYLKSRGLTSVVIGRDARHGSAEFLQESAEILSGAGLEVHLLPRELPTPVLAFAVNHLKVDCGIMITASHNPAADNGYKVYLGGTVDSVLYCGSQIISPADSQISTEISKINSKQPRGSKWQVVDESVIDSYISQASKTSQAKVAIKVVYTAMHGVGTETFLKTISASGFSDPILVKEQAEPDPDFPTVPFPNPEEAGAIDLAIKYASENSSDLVIANDPDADRCAIAAKDPDLGWRMLRGDELGTIFGYYLATNQSNSGRTFANSIVSSSALAKIAEKYQITFAQTLTGFKWLAKVANLSYGYEEAIGYNVAPSITNDKDGITAAVKIAEIASVLKSEDRNFFDYLDQIWEEIGYHRTEQISIRVSELSRITEILDKLRQDPPAKIAGLIVKKIDDLLKPTDGLLPTDGLRFWLEENVRVIIRPSGTEPKVKCYIELVRPTPSKSEKIFAEELVKALRVDLSKVLS